jgi:uncharacterized protein (TIGR02246 family)
MKRRNFHSALATLAVALLSAAATHAQERREVPEFRRFGTPSAMSSREVDELIDAYRDAWGRQDTPALIRLHSDDTEWINAFARIIRGTDALAAFLAERLFPAFDPAVSKEEAEGMQTISIRHLGDDAAVVHMFTESRRGAARTEDESARRTHIHLVLEKEDGRWRIVHTAIMDAR